MSVASVISTGGAGGDFERRVGAYFLALLLTKSFMPIFSDAAPQRVHFQARRLGWRIDDLVVEAQSEAGLTHRVAAQIKRTFTLSLNDEECRETLAAAWADFNNATLFQQGRDAIVLVTFLGTNRIQRDVRWLIGQARAAGDAADFLARRQGQGTLNKQAKADYETIKAIIDQANGSPVADENVWRFLQAFHVLSFDFQDAAAKDAAAILTLLASLQAAGGEADAASSTWSELIDFAGLAAAEGRSVDFASLPERAKTRHSQVPSSKHGELSRLRQHSATTLRRLAAAGPQEIVFDRIELRAQLEAAVAEQQVVLVVGPAGSGKSVLGINYLSGAASADTNFAFSAEEFKAAHIDQVLTNASLNLTWKELESQLPLHRKTFFVDGLERLLEASERAAFKDLLLSVKYDSSISLVITCRDYYAEVVERSLLMASNVTFAKIVVGGLSDAELSQAEAAAPTLQPLLANQSLRSILRNPFLLTRASQLRLAQDESIPQTERALRRRMWSELVRDDAYVADGMPSKREKVFFDVCIARARALRPYVEVADVDGALQRLGNANLVANDQFHRFAAAHDVFEDWGLIEWFTRRFEAHSGSSTAMAGEVGGHPALRRAYRKWLTEQLDVDRTIVDQFISEVSSEKSLPPHFVDDTWLAVFQSSAAGSFMTAFAGKLFADEGALLQRVLHLVRVGCKTVSPKAQGIHIWLRWHVPTGNAWPILLAFMDENWEAVPRRMDSLLVAFMEDWSANISGSEQLPEGADSVGSLIEKLLALPTNAPGRVVPRERLVEILMKAPRANEALFKSIASRASAPGSIRLDEDARHFAKLTFEPFKAIAFASAFPRELQAVCLGRWFASDKDDRWSSSRELEAVFGLTHSYEHRFFPRSSMQGPMLFLLRAHPSEGVRFIVNFINQCCSNYKANSQQQRRLIEPPHESELTLSDGRARSILENQRLWQTYRGTHVMPAVMECALMALEAWFLDIAEGATTPEVFQSFLNYILNNSNNAASLGVVASACLAHPDLAGDCCVSILGSTELIRMDVARMMADKTALAPGGFDVFSQMFQRERLDSKALPHRKHHLEELAIQLQLGPQRASMEALLDRYLAALPPEHERTTEQSQWMLALRRMDLRTYDRRDVGDRVEFTMGELPSDVQAMVQDSEAFQVEFMKRIELQNWAHRHKDDGVAAGDESWRDKLALAKEVEGQIAVRGTRDILEGGGRMVAAVIARDRWAVLDPVDRQWCLETIVGCLGEIPSEDVFGGSIPVDGKMECAAAIGALAPLVSQADAELLLEVSLTHWNQHVQQAAVQSLAHQRLWDAPSLLNFALHVLVAAARATLEQDAELEKLPWNQHPSASELRQQRQAQFAAIDRSMWGSAPPLLDPHLLRHDHTLALYLLLVFRSRTGSPLALQLFEWIGDQFERWWDRMHEDRDQNFELHIAAQEAFANFLIESEASVGVALLQRVLPQVAGEPNEFAKLLDDLIRAADARGDGTTFWTLWALIAAEAQKAKWFAELRDDRSWGGSLIRSLLLSKGWKAGVREWRLLGAASQRVDALFVALPVGGLALEAYGDYLLSIGNPSLPAAVRIIQSRMGEMLEDALKRSSSARTAMDQLVSRLMFEDLPGLQSATLRAPTLALLDALVQAGSSNAFLLREDFLTPSGGVGR
ncbi:hypothetical protein DBA29_24790 [Xenophilus aerolatus]|nr:hypothetical protein [Xenophilus aerolatus]